MPPLNPEESEKNKPSLAAQWEKSYLLPDAPDLKKGRSKAIELPKVTAYFFVYTKHITNPSSTVVAILFLFFRGGRFKILTTRASTLKLDVD